MKYVKVLKFNEYSVFEVIEEYEKTIKCKLTNCENGYIIIGKNNVVKEADTLVELCDEFVFVVRNKTHWLILGETSFKEALEEMKKLSGREIYGAIWTSKGLIYVAKMNENGELELL